MKQAIRAVLVLAILGMGAYLLGFWSPGGGVSDSSLRPVAGPADTSAVRQRMNRLDAQAGRVVEKVDAYVSDAGLSAKIKSKMALDELVGARTIDVSTTSNVVTLEGTVRSLAERDQALRLARDTAGVTRVVDRLVVLP